MWPWQTLQPNNQSNNIILCYTFILQVLLQELWFFCNQPEYLETPVEIPSHRCLYLKYLDVPLKALQALPKKVLHGLACFQKEFLRDLSKRQLKLKLSLFLFFWLCMSQFMPRDVFILQCCMCYESDELMWSQQQSGSNLVKRFFNFPLPKNKRY